MSGNVSFGDRAIQGRKIWWACLWPGLARLWFRGDLAALVTALGFSLLLNLALMSTFLWTSWPGKGFPLIVWPIVGLVWLGSAVVTWWHLDQIVHPRQNADENEDTLLIRAQTEYLKGNWSEVQSLVSRRLKTHPRDVPARLLLATLFRHTGKYHKALQHLEILSRFDESGPWRFEIGRECEIIRQIEPEIESSPSDPNDQRVNNLENESVKSTSVDLIDDDHEKPEFGRAA